MGWLFVCSDGLKTLPCIEGAKSDLTSSEGVVDFLVLAGGNGFGLASGLHPNCVASGIVALVRIREDFHIPKASFDVGLHRFGDSMLEGCREMVGIDVVEGSDPTMLVSSWTVPSDMSDVISLTTTMNAFAIGKANIV